MPQIIRDVKQEQALETVSNHLAEISKINAIISAGNYEFRLQSVGGGKVKLDVAASQVERVIAMLKERKKELVREVRTIAKANRLGFDDKEELAMSDEGFNMKKKKSGVVAQTEDIVTEDSDVEPNAADDECWDGTSYDEADQQDGIDLL